MADQQKTKHELMKELAELRQQEAQWRSLVADMPVFVATVDRAGTIQYLNHPAPGYSPEDALGKSAYEFLEPSYRETARKCVEHVFDTGQTAFYETVAAAANRTTAWYETYVGPVKVGEKVVAATLVSKDITRRKEAEQERDRTQVILQATIDSLPFEFFTLGLDGRYFLQNATLRNRAGDVLGKSPEEFALDEAMLRIWLDNNRRALAGEQIDREIVMDFDGQTSVYRNILGPIIKDGQICGALGFSWNITEQKWMEESLRSSEQKYRRLHESMMDAFVSVDMSGKIQEFNESYRIMLGYEEEELLTFHYTDLTPEKWHKFQAEIIEKQVLQRGYSDIYEKEYHRKDGTIVPVELRTYLVTDDQNQPCGMWAIIRDTTERKQAEAALQVTEERYRRLAESTTDVIAIHDRNGTLLYGNPAGAAYFGIEPSSAIGMTQQELFPPDMVRKHTESIAKVFQTGELFETDGAYPHGSGEIWFNTRLIPLRDEFGQVTSVMSVSRNITKRKQAEEALKKAHDELERRVEERTAELMNTNEQLRQSHNELRTIYDGMVDGLLVTDIETQRFMRANAAICRMLGYSETELLSLSVSDIHPAEALSSILDHFPLVADSPATSPGEIPFLRKDGSTFYAEAIGKFLTYDGRPCSMGIFRDITERRQAKAALQQSRDELQAIYDGMIDGLLLADIETKQFVRANSSMCRILGYSEEQLLSMSVKDIHPPEELASVSEAFRAFAEGRIVVFDDISFLRKDRSVFYAQATGRTVVYNGRSCVIGFFRDITERKRAEEALRQSEERHRGLLEACPDAIVMADLNGKILFASRQTGELVGLSDQEELVGQSVFDYVIEDDRPRLAENMPRLVQSGVRRNIQYTVLRQGGTTVPTEISSALNRDAKGQPIAIMVVIRDITERKQAQDALQREHRTLKHLLQSSDHERQSIAYEIHDGLAQYLAAAIMQFDVYKGHQEKRPNEATKAYDAAITLLCQGHSEARRLIAGIRHPVLDEAGVVEAVAHLINEQNRKKEQQIEFHSLVNFSRLIPLLENAIYRIIQEGMTNACKYSQSSRVRITLLQQKDRLRIEIRDWGIGFNTKDIKEGCYGLTGIRERARLLGGKYRIQSAAGKGTRILVELPLMERDS